MVSSISSNNSINNHPDELLSERHLRKRLAARVRQQRCRARKRQAKVVKVKREVKAPIPNTLHRQVVRGPVILRSHPQMTMPLLHHPTSPFIIYQRRAPAFMPSSPGNHVWSSPIQPSHGSPGRNIPFLGNGRPLHQEIMTGSAFALGMCRSPPTHHQYRNVHVPRVSPIAESSKRMVPLLPELDRLERNEETAIDAMLSLHRTPSKLDRASPLVHVQNY